MATNLSLRIHSVKCVDETGGKWAERVGNDEIYLGGFLIDPAGRTIKVSPMSIYPHFDDGDIKKFNPPRVFSTLNIHTATSWPKNCVAGFLLFEKDSGDMSSAVQKIYEKVVEEMERKKQQMMATRVRATVLTADGTEAPAEEPSLGSVIWNITKEIVYNYIKTKITAGLADELFPLQEASVTLHSPEHTWNGSHTSPVAMVEFRAHEGVYQLFYDWELT